MAIPEGYEKLAVIGIAYKGEYKPGTVYGLLNAVYYNGSTFVALMDNPDGPPVADGTNWQYMAKGFLEGVLSAITATDISGVLGKAGEIVGAQTLLDAIADRVMNKLLAKSQLVSDLLATEPGNPLDASVGPVISHMIDEINGNLAVEEIQLTNLMAAGSKLYKSGHIYTLVISMASIECSNGLMIGSIPSQHAPLSIIYAPIVATGNLTKLSVYLNAGISINTSGHIQISGVIGTGNIITTATWIK